MATPYIGEIRMFAGNFAPLGWASCNGQLLSIDQNPTLFNLIGTNYGGDGQNNFALPNLQSRFPVHVGAGTPSFAAMGGAETVTLSAGNLPIHTHPAQGAVNGNSSTPSGNYWAGATGFGQYTTGNQANESMAPAAIGATGGGQPHDNMMPYLAINFIIALEGIYPSPN